MDLQHRGVVVAGNGMVAASQPLAVSAGLSVLQSGGNFADAAIAVSAVLCVTEPFASHLGGDAFLMIFDARTRSVTALNGSGAAPRAATTDRMWAGIPLRGMAAAATPGLVDAWFAFHDRWGSRPFAELLAPAISYAADGFPAGYRYSRVFADQEKLIRSVPATAAAFLPTGELPKPGSTVRQPDLAWTLEQIARGGRDAFYLGPIAEKIIDYSNARGGLFACEDLAEHRSQLLDSLQTTYRKYTVHGQPPVSQGHIVLQMLNILEGYDLASMGSLSADTIHLQVEAKKRAFADRTAYLGDPAFVNVPMQQLLSKGYAASRRAEIDPMQASAHVTAGQIDHDTTYFCVCDANGYGVSFIQSVFWGFGCAEVVEGTGMLFNNRMTGFTLDPASPNVLAPGKRTAHTLNAYLLTRDDANGRPTLAMVGGTPGGDVQVQSNVQVICNAVDFGMNPQQAVEAPRWQHGGAVGAPGEVANAILAIEERVPEETRDELERRGHTVSALPAWGHGSSYQLIGVQPESGAYLGGSDPRCDGHAAGF